LHTTLATPVGHHQPSPLQGNSTLYTLRELVIPKRASYFPRDEDEKEENGRTSCKIKAFTYMCSVIVASATCFGDLTKRSFYREEVISKDIYSIR
jgi:hypothetical protein